uniref:NADH-ubiquinone oxidoreductase chain 3 n=1 Tax=Damon diadema TaxID=317680 RepID=B5U6K5_9ARAC|nr:NADH dehydrogenase subunit 3 [Damon diadema]ACI02273.1 NADH dehydrogenase subunit 3 [Damon diadema]
MLLKTIMTLSIIPLILLLIIITLMKKMNEISEMKSPFECGFDPLTQTRIPFSIQFFLIAILFLIFDVEISLILPIPFSLSLLSSPWLAFSVFMLILLVGLIHEWNMGSLEWSK